MYLTPEPGALNAKTPNPRTPPSPKPQTLNPKPSNSEAQTALVERRAATGALQANLPRLHGVHAVGV